MDAKKHKPTIILISAVVLIALGCGLLIAGFVTPPPGEIHNSVLVAFGEILTFAGACFGMKYHYQYGASRVDSDIRGDVGGQVGEAGARSAQQTNTHPKYHYQYGSKHTEADAEDK